MGADDDLFAVLDPALRVRGVTGLRVADASVFPTIPSVNPVLTVMLTAERAADLIRQQAGASLGLWVRPVSHRVLRRPRVSPVARRTG